MNCDFTANLLENCAEQNVSPEIEFGWSSDTSMLIFIMSERVLLSEKQHFLKQIKRKKTKKKSLTSPQSPKSFSGFKSGNFSPKAKKKKDGFYTLDCTKP